MISSIDGYDMRGHYLKEGERREKREGKRKKQIE
jgi:hypothetical protein